MIEPETWLFSRKRYDKDYFDLHNSRINHYKDLYPVEKYQDKY